MKATTLSIRNIGLIADAEIEFNKPLLLFYGEIQQGKTTLLNAVKWVFGGTFPSDIIRTGESEALVSLGLDCGSIERQWYRAKDGSTKARPVVFMRDGAPVTNPVAEIKKFLNPFLLDQDYLRNMSELERKKYFAATFAVDTAGLDKQISTMEQKAQEVRSKLKGYGDIDLTPVERPSDIDALRVRRASVLAAHKSKLDLVREQLATRRSVHKAQALEIELANRAANEGNYQRRVKSESANALVGEIAAQKARLERLQAELSALDAWIADHPEQTGSPLPTEPDFSALEQLLQEQPDTSEVDAEISKVAADRVKYEQYQANQTRASARQQDEHEIEQLDAEVRELRKNKIAKLKQCSEQTGIPGLAFDEAGNFNFEGSEAGMLSTSQIMRLSSMLSAKYPPGFGLELLDRGESLGRSIFDFTQRAIAEQKTILASIVGERPATAPSDVGVFVVEQGVVK